MRTAMRNILLPVALLAMSAVTVVTANNGDMMTVCPNGHRCQNGGVCTETGNIDEATGLAEYACDGQGVSAQGEVTRAAEVYCVKGEAPAQSTTFCVHEGTCTTVIKTDLEGEKEVAGCICTQNFEGEHCQFPKGQGPDSGTDVEDGDGDGVRGDDGVTGIRSGGGGGDTGLSTGAIIGISIGAFIFTICLACIVKRVVSKDDDDPPSIVAGGDEDEQ